MHDRASAEPPERLGLRARKRAAAMRTIQAVAVGLFEQRGFDAVTIEEIARAAEVSPSSVYRYFGTKEALLLRDDQDAVMLEAMSQLMRVHDVWDAALIALQDVHAADWEEQREMHLRRMRFYVESSSVRSRAVLELDKAVAELTTMLAAPQAAVRRSPLEAQLVARAFVWGLVTVMEHWYQAGGTDDLMAMTAQMIRTLRTGPPADEPLPGPPAQR